MRNYFLIMLLLVLFGGCNSTDSKIVCDREKAFISVQDFYYSAFEPDEPKIDLCNPFLFDTLRRIDQIDSFRNYLCNRKKIDCSGCISLKYPYGGDTIYIPAFNVVCNCMADPAPIKRFHIFLKDGNLENVKSDINRNFALAAFKDSLKAVFSKSTGDFCKLMSTRKPYFNNPDSLEVWRYFDNSYRNTLEIEISDDTQIQYLRKYIDVSYSIYLKELRSSLKTIYHSDICNLSKYEFKSFSRGLFFSINLHKEYPLNYIAPHETH